MRLRQVLQPRQINMLLQRDRLRQGLGMRRRRRMLSRRDAATLRRQVLQPKDAPVLHRGRPRLGLRRQEQLLSWGFLPDEQRAVLRQWVVRA
jgi:hypothetical protein